MKSEWGIGYVLSYFIKKSISSDGEVTSESEV